MRYIWLSRKRGRRARACWRRRRCADGGGSSGGGRRRQRGGGSGDVESIDDVGAFCSRIDFAGRTHGRTEARLKECHQSDSPLLIKRSCEPPAHASSEADPERGGLQDINNVYKRERAWPISLTKQLMRRCCGATLDPRFNSWTRRLKSRAFLVILSRTWSDSLPFKP